MEIIYEKAVFAPKGGKPGYIVNGKWYPVDSKDLGSEGLKRELERYGRLRGTEQIQKDISSLKPKPAPSGSASGSQAPRSQSPTQRPSAPSPASPAASVTRPAPAAPAATVRPATVRPATARPTPTRPVSMQTGDRTKDLTTWALANKAMIDKVGTKSQREILRAAQSGGSVSMPAPRPLTTKEEKMDAFDLVLEYLTSTGHVETLDEALYVMMEMDGETIKSIIEGSGVVTGAAKAINTVLKPINQTPEQEKKAVGSITKGLDVVAKPIKSILSPVDNSPKAQQLRMNKYRTIN